MAGEKLRNLRQLFGKSTRGLFRAAVPELQIAMLTLKRRRYSKK